MNANMPLDEKIIFYGAGKFCHYLLSIVPFKVVHIVDGDKNKWGDYCLSYQIMSPQILSQYKAPLICITVMDINVADNIRCSISALCPSFREILCHKLIFDLMVSNNCFYFNQYYPANIYSKSELTIIIDAPSGLGNGGVEEWIKYTYKILHLITQDTIIILSNNKCSQFELYYKDRVVHLDRAEQYYNIHTISKIMDIINRNKRCLIFTSYHNEVWLASCVMKRYFPNEIFLISVNHSGLKSIAELYCHFDAYIDAYICVNNETKTFLRSKGVANKKIYHMDFPIPQYNIIKRKYSGSSHPIRIGYGGRLSKDKNSFALVDIVCGLENKKINYLLQIAGDGLEKQPIMNQLKIKCPGNHVQFLGMLPRNQMISFWERQDIFINFSKAEGRSISKLEAMECGVIPIVTNTWGMREDISNGKSGFIIPIDDVNKFVDIIMVLNNDKSALPIIGKRAHESIHYKCTKEIYVELLKSILDSI